MALRAGTRLGTDRQHLGTAFPAFRRQGRRTAVQGLCLTDVGGRTDCRPGSLSASQHGGRSFHAPLTLPIGVLQSIFVKVLSAGKNAGPADQGGRVASKGAAWGGAQGRWGRTRLPWDPYWGLGCSSLGAALVCSRHA